MSFQQQLTAVLVTGEMRSGTSLIANFLNSQPACTIYADLMRSLFVEAEKLGIKDLSAALSEREKNVLCSSLAAEGWRMRLSSFAEIDRQSITSWFDLYRSALAALKDGEETRAVGTKITREYRFLPELLRDGVKVVFCFRDPRDVVLSAANRFSDFNLFESLLSWRNSIRVLRRLEHEEGLFPLRFEDVLSPAARTSVMARLADTLGISLELDLDRLQLRDQSSFVSNSSFGDISSLFDETACYRWKGQDSTPQSTFVGELLAEELASLGYEGAGRTGPDTGPLRRGLRLYVAKQRLKRVLLKTYSRLTG